MARNTYPDDPIRDIIGILLEADAREWLRLAGAAAVLYLSMFLMAV